MRLPTLPPEQLTPEQRALHDRIRQQIAHGFNTFTTTREDGALLGPWGVFLHEPKVGQAHYDLIDAVTEMNHLSPSAKQIAILVVGARFNADYELYARAATAAPEGMDPVKIATLAAGGRPLDLTPEEACTFDIATALLGGGVLAGATYRAALDLLGQGALNELVLDRNASVVRNASFTLSADMHIHPTELQSPKTSFIVQEDRVRGNQAQFARERPDTVHAKAPAATQASLRVEPGYGPPSHDAPGTR